MRIRPRKPRPVSEEVQEVADELQKRLAAREVKRPPKGVSSARLASSRRRSTNHCRVIPR